MTSTNSVRTLVCIYSRFSFPLVDMYLLVFCLLCSQSARDIILDAEVVSQNVHDFVHSLVYARYSCVVFPPFDSSSQ